MLIISLDGFLRASRTAGGLADVRGRKRLSSAPGHTLAADVASCQSSDAVHREPHLELAPVQVPVGSADGHVQIAAQSAAALARILRVLIRHILLHHLRMRSPLKTQRHA